MKKLFILLFSIVSAFGYSQDENKTILEKTSLSGLSFREVGPALTSGRIADIAVNPKNHNEYYVAVASGGVLKTVNNGVTFQPLFDSQGSYSIGCVTIDPSNENIIWVGTGENNNQRSVAYGDGVYKSTDGGQSWTNIGLKTSEHIGMIAIHPKFSNIVYVAAYGPVWSAGGERGVYKSTDGGKNWERILNVSENTGFNEVHMDPRNPEVLYATAHQRRRHVWTYVSGGPESAIYKSEDAGKTWNKLENGIPGGDKGRIALSIHPANPDHVYAMVEGHGFYRSTNRGASFHFMNDYNTSGNYYVELVPHPVDVNTLYSLDTYTHVTHDGGKSWEKIALEKRHVDDHCLWIDPDQTDHMIIGGDGGLYETFDNAANWDFKPNLPVTQFYRVTVDNAEPFYNIYGGTQDNFSLGGPSRTINKSGITNADWFVTQTGDGFESQIDPVDPNIIYAQYQYGGLSRFDKKSGEKVGIKPMEGKDDDALRWNWDAPLLISPHNHKRLYFAANKVYKSEDQGNSWELISEDLSQQIDRHTLPVMGKIQSVDAIAYDQSTSQYGNIVALDESPLKEGLLYVGTDDGLIQVSEDGGENWSKVSSFPGVPQNTYVNAVIASLHDENTVFAVFNNHKNGDFKPYVLKSTNRGKSWTSITANLPERGSAYAIRQDHVNKDLLFVGTEFGLHFSNDGGKEWKQLKAGLPTVAVRDIDIQKRENDLVLATFGRGFYVLDNYAPLREIKKDVLEEDKHFFDIKDALVFMEASPLGYGSVGFQGASYYSAPNPEIGATFTYYIKEAPKSLSGQRKEMEKEKIKNNEQLSYPSIDELRAEDREEKSYMLFVISDDQGNEINRMTKAVSAGVQRINWDGTYSSFAELNSDGSPMTNPSSSHLALPGTYSIEAFMVNDGKVSPYFEKKSFKLNWLNNNTFVTETPAELLAFQKDVEQLRRKVNGLRQYKNKLSKDIDKLKAAARNTPGADVYTLDSLRSLDYQLAEIDIIFSGDRSLSKREFETKPSINSRLGSVYWYSFSSTSTPSGSQKANFQIASEQYNELRQQIGDVATKVNSIKDNLIESGAPYLGDELPE
ncbi:BNR/Asp-box repeat protein [Owenweeksia hongkongensis DSM 17368]|uniref:BNR/Asp-box repeat protein n=1 Tax=Owenweeksia hongkongensis (strain DSM 17368 / CIP 108786 / JCM 12287 / NRRL B-23963 / UST20020801) TaxID=926562 RepID=G8R362_OWEHD|nr:glycosyl hydrolase [Owenweeksia hongkongensis]AEV34087.1 BNR/Asp-box repeat protein [Owenweeksia hongkongensis DSM 17368]